MIITDRRSRPSTIDDTEAILRQIDPDWSASPTGRLGIAVRLPDPPALDRLYADLAAVGFGVKQPWDAFWGRRFAVVHDPDGRHIDLYAQLTDGTVDGDPAAN